MKILVYGMDAADIRRIGRVLHRLGHEMQTEIDCEAAVSRIEESKIQVVIGDGRRARFSWIDLCRKLRLDRTKPYVYFLLLENPWADETYEDWATSAGVDDFLRDRADERELRHRLRVAARYVSGNPWGRQVSSTVPVCNRCRRVRDELDHWQEIEGFFTTHTGTQLSPSICPDCYIKNFGLEYSGNRVAESSGQNLT
jgi:PleD family two-component response regulator